MKQFEVRRKQIEYLSKMLEIIVFIAVGKKLGLEGTGFWLIPLMLYTFVWMIAGEHYSDALGRILRSRKAKGQHISVQRIKQMAFFGRLVAGIAGTLALLTIGSAIGEYFLGCPYSGLMLRILAPVVFFRCLSALFIGYSQGEGSEFPAVVSCILRQVLIFGIGLFFGEYLGNYGIKVSRLLNQERYTAMYTGTGWCLAMVLAEIVVLLFLIVSYFGMKKRKAREEESMRATESFGGYVGAIFKGIRYKSLICILEFLPVLLGMMIFYRKTGEGAPVGYGSYFVGYFAVCLLIYYLMKAMAVPFWGKVAGFLKHDDKRLAKICLQGGVHLILGMGLVTAAGFSIMAVPVGTLVGFTSPNLVKVIVPGSFWILFMSLGFYFSRMLMRLGKNLISTGIAVLCDVLFLMIYLILWSNDNMGILALMYAALISAGVYAVMLGAVLAQILGWQPNWLKVIVFPIGAACLTAVLELLVVKLLGASLGAGLIVLIVGGIGFILFWCALILIRSFDLEELSVIPFGGVILALGKMMGVY